MGVRDLLSESPQRWVRVLESSTLEDVVDASYMLDSHRFCEQASAIAGCKEYDAKIDETAVLLDNSIVRETCPISWKDDPTERARRTWKWWIVRWGTANAGVEEGVAFSGPSPAFERLQLSACSRS